MKKSKKRGISSCRRSLMGSRGKSPGKDQGSKAPEAGDNFKFKETPKAGYNLSLRRPLKLEIMLSLRSTKSPFSGTLCS